MFICLYLVLLDEHEKSSGTMWQKKPNRCFKRKSSIRCLRSKSSCDARSSDVCPAELSLWQLIMAGRSRSPMGPPRVTVHVATAPEVSPEEPEGEPRTSERPDRRPERPDGGGFAEMTVLNVSRLPVGPVLWRPDNHPAAADSPASLDSSARFQFFESTTQAQTRIGLVPSSFEQGNPDVPLLGTGNEVALAALFPRTSKDQIHADPPLCQQLQPPPVLDAVLMGCAICCCVGEARDFASINGIADWNAVHPFVHLTRTCRYFVPRRRLGTSQRRQGNLWDYGPLFCAPYCRACWQHLCPGAAVNCSPEQTDANGDDVQGTD